MGPHGAPPLGSGSRTGLTGGPADLPSVQNVPVHRPTRRGSAPRPRFWRPGAVPLALQAALSGTKRWVAPGYTRWAAPPVARGGLSCRSPTPCRPSWHPGRTGRLARPRPDSWLPTPTFLVARGGLGQRPLRRQPASRPHRGSLTFPPWWGRHTASRPIPHDPTKVGTPPSASAVVDAGHVPTRAGTLMGVPHPLPRGQPRPHQGRDAMPADQHRHGGGVMSPLGRGRYDVQDPSVAGQQ